MSDDVEPLDPNPAASIERVERERVENEIAGWLDDLADHTDSSHDHDLIATIAQSIRWGEHRGWNTKPPEAPRIWYPHLDYAGEPMREGEFRDPPF